MALEITDNNFKEILAEGKPVVIDFWAPWCGPCKMVGTASPVMHKYIKYPLKWALQNKLRSMQGKTVCLDKKWCDVGQDPCQGDLREKF